MERLYSLCKMVSLESKKKIAKNMRKTTVQGHYSFSMQNTARKNSYCSKNERFLKIGQNGHYAKAIPIAKWSVWGQKIKLPKTCETRLYKDITVVLCKKRLKKKQLIFKKWEDFKNWPNGRYSLCKMVSLGSKNKIAKNIQKETVQGYYSCSI